MKDLLKKADKLLGEIDTRVLPTGVGVAIQNLRKEIDDAVAEPVPEKKVAKKKPAKKKVAKKKKVVRKKR